MIVTGGPFCVCEVKSMMEAASGSAIVISGHWLGAWRRGVAVSGRAYGQACSDCRL
jgi:hypothetical protein